ncbi:MAG: LCP family protein, partial [Anaerolineae bacterium]
MDRGIRFLEWSIVIGLLVLLVLGAQAAQNAQEEQVAVLVVTPTTTPTATPTSPTATATVPPTWTPTPEVTPTPLPTGTPLPSPTPTMTPTPAPINLPPPVPILTGTAVVSSPLPQPTPMPRIPQPEGTINILLLGMDREGGTGYARTDVMMIASVFPDMPAVSLISIPRDYYAWIPTWGLDKINTAFLRGHKTGYPGGGPGLAKATIAYNFGLPIHYYSLVDFDSYRSIVDAVGGVDIIVECPLHDTYPDPESPTGATDIDMEPGLHHLSGKYALWYVRSRWNTSDFDRHRRQQQVLRAVFYQAMTQNIIPRIPEFWGVYKDDVETDLGLKDMLYLGSIGARFDMRNLKSRFIRGSTLVQGWTAPNGGAVLVPQYDALYPFVLEAAQPPVTSRATQRAYRVEIWNGSGRSNWGDVAAYRL